MKRSLDELKGLAVEAFIRYIDPDRSDFNRKVAKILVLKRLEQAGYDVETDAPFKECLGLRGGKAEFDRPLNFDPYS